MKRIVPKFVSLFRRITGKNIKPYHLNYHPSASGKKIIHFNGNFVIGGTSQLIADLVERTSDLYSHHIIVPSVPKPLPYEPLPVTALVTRDEIYSFLQSERPALVHIHYWVRPMHRYYDFGIWYDMVFQICEELQLKVIQNINVPTHPRHSSAVVHNVFVSQYVKNEFNNDPDTLSSVIYPGSDLRHFSPEQDHVLPDDTIGMVYRLDPDKLNEAAIEPFIIAAKKNDKLRCYIVGGGHYLSLYKKRVKQEKLQQRFIFTGYVSYYDLPPLYKLLGLVVAPVHDESFGQVTPFAMGMGIPVAGYDTGALREILGSADTLVPYGNQEALADIIFEINGNT